jgi:hypothetical protein
MCLKYFSRLFEKVNNTAELLQNYALLILFFLNKYFFTDRKDVLCMLNNFVDNLLMLEFKHIFEFLITGLIKNKNTSNYIVGDF